MVVAKCVVKRGSVDEDLHRRDATNEGQRDLFRVINYGVGMGNFGWCVEQVLELIPNVSGIHYQKL